MTQPVRAVDALLFPYLSCKTAHRGGFRHYFFNPAVQFAMGGRFYLPLRRRTQKRVVW